MCDSCDPSSDRLMSQSEVCIHVARVTKVPAVAPVTQGRLCQAGHGTSSGLGIAAENARQRCQVNYCVEEKESGDQVRRLQSNVRTSAPKCKLSSSEVSVDACKTKLQLHRKSGARFPLRITTWNVHTFNVAGQVESVSREADRLRLNCLGVSETR